MNFFNDSSNGYNEVTITEVAMPVINSMSPCWLLDVDVLLGGMFEDDMCTDSSDAISNNIQQEISELRPYCTIQYLSFAFGFDCLQHAAFCRMAVTFLLSLGSGTGPIVIFALSSRPNLELTRSQEQARHSISSANLFYLGEKEAVESIGLNMVHRFSPESGDAKIR